MENGKQEFVFEYIPKQPRLLPFADAPAKGKDSLSQQKDLFTLETADIQEEYIAPPVPPEDGQIAEEPATGVESDWFDKHNYELTRFAKKYPPRVPHLLKRNVLPLRPPEAFKPNEKVVGLDQVLSFVTLAPATITYLCLADVTLPKKKLKALPKALSAYVNVEVLLLRGLRLASLPGCKFPNLRFLDLSHNAFSKVANIINVVKHSPNLDVLNVSHNPCAYREDVVGRVLAVCLYLGVVNDKELSVAERINALELHGPRSMRDELPWLRWDMALDLIPEISQMRISRKGWDSQLITAISLPNCGLTNISVAAMVNLQVLDLSNNRMSDLRNTGMEQCNVLSRVNLKHNLLEKVSHCVPIFAMISSLLSLFLEGNQVVLKKNFRSRLIFQTRNLRGTNRVPGLLEIEGAVVSLEERVGAMEMWGNQSDPHDNPQAFRWHMNMVAKYGHLQVKTQLQKMITCAFPNKNLTFASLHGFFMLQRLDLSWNNLTEIAGLEQLELLTWVDLTENPKLSTTKILKQLAQCTRLESFSFFVTGVPDHKRAPNAKSYRETVLRSLLFTNRSLKAVDNEAIKKEERIETYRGVGGSGEDVEAYRFNLALTLNCCSSVTSGGQDLRYHFTEVGVGEQYDPTNITGLRRLAKWGLTSRACNFAPFINLVELNVSHNQLTDIEGIGLETLKHLRVFCATHNNISTPHQRIAALLDSIAQLEVVCLRENPIMRNSDDRMKLLGMLQNQRVFAPVLHTIDSAITLGERVEAWKRMDPDNVNEEAERLRFTVVLHVFSLHHNQPIFPRENLTVLDLSYSELGFVDVVEFVNLRELILVGNRLVEDTLDKTGIAQLRFLEILDLRFNNFSKLEPLAALVSQLPLLETFGLQGNKCAPVGTMLSTLTMRDTRGYRVRLLSLVPDTLRVRGHALNVLDSKEITIEERAQACKADGSAELSSSLPNLPQDPQVERRSTLAGIEQKAKDLLTLRKGSIGSHSQNSLFDPKVMCWPMALLRRLPPVIPYSAITEADFSNCFLTVLDLSVLPALVKLSLANNSIREMHLEKSNIAALNDLRMLDLRGNQLKALSQVCEMVGRIPRLENLWIENNPCFHSNNPASRVRFFKKMRRGDLLLSMLNGHAVMPPDLVKLGQSKRRASDML